jgi:hypothetical protein
MGSETKSPLVLYATVYLYIATLFSLAYVTMNSYKIRLVPSYPIEYVHAILVGRCVKLHYV